MEIEFSGGPLDGERGESHPLVTSVLKVDRRTGVVHRYRLRHKETPNRVAVFIHCGALKNDKLKLRLGD